MGLVGVWTGFLDGVDFVHNTGELIYIMDDQACCAVKKTAIQWLKHLESVGKSLIIQVRLSSPLRLPNIHHQSLQWTHQLLI